MLRIAAICQLVLGIGLVVFGTAKVLGAANTERDRLEVAVWLWIVAGVVEVVGGIGMLVGWRRPVLAAGAGALIGTQMVGALVVHVRSGDPAINLIYPALVMVMAGIVTAVRLTAVDRGVRAERAVVPAGRSARQVGSATSD